MKNCFALLVGALLAVPVAVPAHAQGVGQQQAPADMRVVKTVLVMGHDVIPTSGPYVVTKDVNVRSGPATTFKRVGGLLSGDYVRAIGKTEGDAWMAVSKDGVTLGYVFRKNLSPVLDGALKEQFLGAFMSPPDPQNKGAGIACDYRFRFERKANVEGAAFQTADYEIRFRCASQKGAVLFYGQMFLTEAPVKTRTGQYLINLDVRSIGDGLEEYLSSRFLYNPKTGKLVFDGHSLPRFAVPPSVQTFSTVSVKDALRQALEASMSSWTAAAWDTLFSRSVSPAE